MSLHGDNVPQLCNYANAVNYLKLPMESNRSIWETFYLNLLKSAYFYLASIVISLWMYDIFMAITSSIPPLTQSKLLGSFVAITIIVSKLSLGVKGHCLLFTVAQEGLNSSNWSYLVSEGANSLTEGLAFSPTLFLEE